MTALEPPRLQISRRDDLLHSLLANSDPTRPHAAQRGLIAVLLAKAIEEAFVPGAPSEFDAVFTYVQSTAARCAILEDTTPGLALLMLWIPQSRGLCAFMRTHAHDQNRVDRFVPILAKLVEEFMLAPTQHAKPTTVVGFVVECRLAWDACARRRGA